MIDNYDSFTYNIVQYFSELGQEVLTVRNDKITLNEIKTLNPKRICLSPGPCSPKDANICIALLKTFAKKLPILGICLGHQAIGEAFGGHIVRAKQIVHGKASKIIHNGVGIFKGIPSPYNAIRYHSLAIHWATLPTCFEVTAWTEDKEIMGIRHKIFNLHGVQFHPESILSEHGHQLLNNFLKNTTVI